MNGVRVGYYLLLVLIIASCKSKDKQAVDIDNIYFDYQVHAAEGDDNLTILLQYREEDEEGDGLSMGPVGSVKLDGEMIAPDSTKMGGFFYETHKPILSFAGKHNIVLSVGQEQSWSEQFEFQPVQLLTGFTDTIRRGDIELLFGGLKEGERVRTLMTDTSFINDGINRVDRIYDNRIVIDSADLDRLANGPVQLELIREYERPIEKDDEKKGRLRITYTLKREFILSN